MAWRRQGGSFENAGLISPETGQTCWVTEATTDRSCARRGNSCHSVTCGQGGSGSEGNNQKGRTLSDLSSLLPTSCCHHLALFAQQVTSPKFLAAHQSSTGFLSCGKSLPCHWPCLWVQPAERSLLWRHGGVQRSEQSCPVQEWSFFIFMPRLGVKSTGAGNKSLLWPIQALSCSMANGFILVSVVLLDKSEGNFLTHSVLQVKDFHPPDTK